MVKSAKQRQMEAQARQDLMDDRKERVRQKNAAIKAAKQDVAMTRRNVNALTKKACVCQ